MNAALRSGKTKFTLTCVPKVALLGIFGRYLDFDEILTPISTLNLPEKIRYRGKGMS
jgi:hypothetical protein